MKKKHFGYGNFFCWHCGKRQIVGRYRCPYCGADYNHPDTSKVKYTVHPRPGLGNLHPTVLRAHVKYIIYSILFGLLWSVVVMYWLGAVRDKRVYMLIWGFWAVWLIGFSISNMKKVRKARAFNRESGPTVKCGYCGHEHLRVTNYCCDCGCIIMKSPTEDLLTVDPDMNTVGISPTHTKDGKRRKKKKRNWGMIIFWIVFIGLTMWSIYVTR